MTTKLLVPVDGSAESERALDYALDLATAFDATLQVVHFSNSRTDATETILERAAEAVSGHAFAEEPRVELVELDVWTDAGVGKAIVNFVEDGDYDHVVMGHHGSGAVGRAILGSAAETVVRSESVPVTVVP